MTDEIDPSRLLASAAFDDEATSDERVQVAASSELQDEVEAYRDLRDQLRDVEVPPAARESAITAALAAFDSLATSVRTVAPVVALHGRRQRQYRWLGGAAAAALIGVLVVGAIATSGGQDEKSSSVAEQASPVFDSAAKAPAPELPPVAAAATAAAAETSVLTAANATPVDPWAGARSINSEDELIAYASEFLLPPAPAADVPEDTSADNADTDSTTADTTLEATGGPGAASTPLTTPPGKTTAAGGTVALYSCAGTAVHPTAAVIYRGAHALMIVDEAAGTITVIDPVTCFTLQTVVIPQS